MGPINEKNRFVSALPTFPTSCPHEENHSVLLTILKNVPPYLNQQATAIRYFKGTLQKHNSFGTYCYLVKIHLDHMNMKKAAKYLKAAKAASIQYIYPQQDLQRSKIIKKLEERLKLEKEVLSMINLNAVTVD
jgi:hypothetical protein